MGTTELRLKDPRVKDVLVPWARTKLFLHIEDKRFVVGIPFTIFVVDIFCHAWCNFALLAITH
ncbi:MAG: hypothetical protein JW384_04118 [Nitrosomonadaceae bacterium]|nr:hypothetical protein [Nitrosomonadaceae bacterium]